MDSVISQLITRLLMMKVYKGQFPFTRTVLESWDSNENGVYYIGALTAEGNLWPYYIGKGTGDGGMKARLLDHLGRWSDTTHFGYEGGSVVSEIEAHEIAEIKRYSPKYNIQHT